MSMLWRNHSCFMLGDRVPQDLSYTITSNVFAVTAMFSGPRLGKSSVGFALEVRENEIVSF